MCFRSLLIAAVACTLSLACVADAVIMEKLELKKVLADSQYIVLAKVDQLYPEKPAMILTLSEDLKGKSPFARLPTNLKGDKEAEQHKHVPQLLRRLAPDLPLVLFIHHNDKLNQF